MKTIEPIIIVVATDDKYMVLLAVLIKSIEKHLSSERKINLYIIEDKVSQNNKEKLLKSIDSSVTSVIWKNVNEINLTGYKIPMDWSSWPITIHLRLFFPYLLGPGVDKILYLDVDMMLQTDISELYDTPLDGFVIAAVTDERIKSFDNPWGGIKNYNELALVGSLAYFNTGLLLINCNEWIKYETTYKVIDCINENKSHANFPDQYGLNIVLVHRWKSLDATWNYFSTGKDLSAKLIHFIERKPIFNSYNGNPEFKKIFLNYVEGTEWGQIKEKSDIHWYWNKLKNRLTKYINYLFR